MFWLHNNQVTLMYPIIVARSNTNSIKIISNHTQRFTMCRSRWNLFVIYHMFHLKHRICRISRLYWKTGGTESKCLYHRPLQWYVNKKRGCNSHRGWGNDNNRHCKEANWWDYPKSSVVKKCFQNWKVRAQINDTGTILRICLAGFLGATCCT